jgi:transcriptional regulator with XRE-family HTH domain
MGLRVERQRRGWSQTRLSALTGISSPDLSAIENGHRPVYPSWRRRLEQVFGMPAEQLFAADEQPDTTPEASR